MHIYLDESGDLGFNFEGGSSKFFVITFISSEDNKALVRSVRKVRTKYQIPKKVEIKGSKSEKKIKKEILAGLSSLDIEIYSIILNKKRVYQRLRGDTNILYNYVAGLILAPYIINCNHKKISIKADNRIIKVTSGFRFNEYIKTKIWYESRKDINLYIDHLDSQNSYGIQAVDVVCNSIYRKYAKRDTSYYNIIRDKIKKEQKLFF